MKKKTNRFIQFLKDYWPIILLVLMIIFGVYWAKP